MKGLKYLLIILGILSLLLVSTLFNVPLNTALAQVTATPAVLQLVTSTSVPTSGVVITSPMLVSELHG